eukprot:g5478.t1
MGPRSTGSGSALTTESKSAFAFSPHEAGSTSTASGSRRKLFDDGKPHGPGRFFSFSSLRQRLRAFKAALSEAFRTTFLPVNYPDSVPEEYCEFQVYDSLQGLC